MNVNKVITAVSMLRATIQLALIFALAIVVSMVLYIIAQVLIVTHEKAKCVNILQMLMNVNKAIIAVSMQRATTQLGLIFARATVVSTALDLIAQVFS
jgi:hypothetical protein